MSSLSPENSEKQPKEYKNMPDLNKIIEDLSSLTVVEAAELSKQLRRKMGCYSNGCSSTSSSSRWSS